MKQEEIEIAKWEDMKKTAGSSCYKDFPAFYDFIYRRYFKTLPGFLRLVKKNTPRGGRILDLAAGTGLVSLALLKDGFRVISLDVHPGMLKELAAKAKKIKIKNYQTVCKDILQINYRQDFDTVCIRQAVNYLMGPARLRKGFRLIRRALRPGGAFIFNAPNFRKGKKYQEVVNIYRVGSYQVFCLEKNSMKSRVLTHRQYCLIWGDSSAGIGKEQGKKPVYLKEENSFFMYTKNDFYQALKRAGFSKIRFYSSGLKKFRTEDKTLYCLAYK